MKRTFSLLLVIIIILYAKEGYELVTNNAPAESKHTGFLSEIAQKVTAIPLQPTGEHRIEKARSVRQEGDNLFLISNDILYRFNKSGEFICRITNPESMLVAGYVIDPIKRMLIVLGNTDDIHYYSFSGQLITQKKLENDGLYKKIHSIAMLDNYIWTAEESVSLNKTNNRICIEKQVVKYDSTFRKIESFKMITADLMNNQLCPYSFHVELGITEDTGNIYAYSPSLIPDNLLRDTLFIRNSSKNPGYNYLADEITVYPLRFGRRYWISSYYDPYDSSKSYTFCFDNDSSKSWQIKEGFKDNFYHTGSIPELQPMDAYSNLYCYCKSGPEAKKTFPDLKESDNPVIFIVQMKA